MSNSNELPDKTAMIALVLCVIAIFIGGWGIGNSNLSNKELSNRKELDTILESYGITVLDATHANATTAKPRLFQCRGDGNCYLIEKVVVEFERDDIFKEKIPYERKGKAAQLITKKLGGLG
jgi:hypothetical protein